MNKELDEIFGDALLDVSDKELMLFNLPSDMKRAMERRRIQPDHYAQRTPCEDFLHFKPLFEKVQKELKEGKRSLIRTSKTSNLDEGHFYVVDGILVMLQSIEQKTRSRNGMIDGRTRCIYENGTESDILLQTLRTNVLYDGYAVTDPQGAVDEAFFRQRMAEGDKSTGYVYVLRSLSPDEQIACVKDLYKIGFTINTVEERVANAAHDPTYLMAPVQIVETAEIVNMNSHVFETIIHQVFRSAQYQMKVYDDEGQLHIPTEWFVVPLDIINLVIQKIADGTITQYVYNASLQCLEKRVVRNESTFCTEGLKVLTLRIKERDLRDILKGEKTSEHREIRQTSLNKFTYIDEADGKRYLRRYDVIRFHTGRTHDHGSALVEVTDTSCVNGIVEYKLGRILEHVDSLKASSS